jgi:hypothetical protein
MKSYNLNNQELSGLIAAAGDYESNLGSSALNFGSGLTLWDVLINTINWLTWISVGLGVLFLVVGGIQFMTASGDKEKARVAAETVKYSIIGLTLVFGFAIAVNIFVTMFL